MLALEPDPSFSPHCSTSTPVPNPFWSLIEVLWKSGGLLIRYRSCMSARNKNTKLCNKKIYQYFTFSPDGSSRAKIFSAILSYQTAALLEPKTKAIRATGFFTNIIAHANCSRCSSAAVRSYSINREPGAFRCFREERGVTSRSRALHKSSEQEPTHNKCESRPSEVQLLKVNVRLFQIN